MFFFYYLVNPACLFLLSVGLDVSGGTKEVSSLFLLLLTALFKPSDGLVRLHQHFFRRHIENSSEQPPNVGLKPGNNSKP